MNVEFSDNEEISDSYAFSDEELDEICENFFTGCNSIYDKWCDSERSDDLYIAAHSFSIELGMEKARNEIMRVEEAYKQRSNELIQEYGNKAQIDIKQFLLGDEPLIKNEIQEQLHAYEHALDETKNAMCEYVEFDRNWGGDSLVGSMFAGFKDAAKKLIKNPSPVGVADVFLDGVSEIFGSGSFSKENDMLSAKLSAAIELCNTVLSNLFIAVISTIGNKLGQMYEMIDAKIPDQESWQKLLQNKNISVEDEEIDYVELARTLTEDMTLEEIQSLLAEYGLDTEGSRKNLIGKVARAIEDGIIVLTEDNEECGEDGDEDESEEEIDYVELARDVTEAMTIPEIKNLLEERGLDSTGTRKNLISKVAAAIESGEIVLE